LPAIAYACRGTDSFILNVEHLHRTMPSQRPLPDTTPVAGNDQKKQMCTLSGDARLPPARRRVFAPAGDMDSSQAGSSVASTIQCQNSSLVSSLNNSGVAGITPCVTSTQSATQR